MWIVGITDPFDSDDVFTIDFRMKVSAMNIEHDTRLLHGKWWMSVPEASGARQAFTAR